MHSFDFKEIAVLLPVEAAPNKDHQVRDGLTLFGCKKTLRLKGYLYYIYCMYSSSLSTLVLQELHLIWAALMSSQRAKQQQLFNIYNIPTYIITKTKTLYIYIYVFCCILCILCFCFGDFLNSFFLFCKLRTLNSI